MYLHYEKTKSPVSDWGFLLYKCYASLGIIINPRNPILLSDSF